MKTEILHIGIIDKNENVHAVSFKSGVNIITGKSSTGKSALIEIFDYCFGSEDFTIPAGVITENAQLYFSVLLVAESYLVLGRRRDEQKAFIKQESDVDFMKKSTNFIIDYFEDDYFISLDDFKVELKQYFRLRVTDVDVNLEDRAYRMYQKKRPSPSVRSFSSFIFQHQNLLANKHAIFYRFEEKEKREQVIEHFKIFVGFADQEYFTKSQELNELISQKNRIERQIPLKKSRQFKLQSKLESALQEYAVNSGYQLTNQSLTDILRNPRKELESIEKTSVKVLASSDEHVKQKSDAEDVLRVLTAKIRKKQIELKDIKSSIHYIESYTEETNDIRLPQEAEIEVSICPFCKNSHSKIEDDANKLNDAIIWLNQELNKSQYMLTSFEENRLSVEREIKIIDQEIKAQEQKIATIEKQIKDLANYKTQYELALKSKMKVENIIEDLLDKQEIEEEKELERIKKNIDRIENYLKHKYNIKDKLKTAENEIISHMNEISRNLEFEDSYKPINLKFSLNTFDLWNEKDRRIFLRSMGSGANWLSCHVALFLALNKYFCSRGEACSIPTVLFFDQPSQVYFPSVLDTTTEFNPEDIAQKEGKDRKRLVDEDIRAVTNLYDQLIEFCKTTLKETGIEPQIIITDHADKLELKEGIDFESLIRARWRDRGFIKVE